MSPCRPGWGFIRGCRRSVGMAANGRLLSSQWIPQWPKSMAKLFSLLHNQLAHSCVVWELLGLRLLPWLLPVIQAYSQGRMYDVHNTVQGKEQYERRQLLKPCLHTHQLCAMPIRQELSWFSNAVRVISGVSPKPTLSIHWKLSLHTQLTHPQPHCWWELLTKFRYLPKPFWTLTKVMVPTSKPPKLIWFVDFIVLSLLVAWVYDLCVLFLSMANLIN